MAAQPSPESPQSPFGVPVFRAVWLASVTSNFGGMIQSVGAAWMMIALGASAQLIALVSASVTLPIMLFALVAGAIADNRDRRRVMLAAQMFMMAASATLSIFALLGWLTPWLLLGFTFLIGCGIAFHSPAWQASVGDMVPRAVLPAAVAYNSMGFNIARSLGPAVGGALVAIAGAASAFAVNTLSYIGLIAVLLRWRPPETPQLLPRERLGDAVATGLRYVLMSPHILSVLARAFVFGIAASAITALMPLMVRDLLGGGPLTYGLLLGAFGAGAVAGALGSGRLRQVWQTEQLVRTAMLSIATGCAICAVSPWVPLTMAALFLAGSGWVLALSSFNVSVQLSAPRWVVARALAQFQMVAFGGMAIGSWLFGWITTHHGVAAALFTAAIGQLAAAALGRWLPVPRLAHVDLDPSDLWSEPQTLVPVEPRSGPVVVTLHYRIADVDIPQFLTTMIERRRIRTRDGARGWTLLRDLGDPLLWIERYHVPTWIEYVRHNKRRTKADLANVEALWALHIGPDKPLVFRMLEEHGGSPSGQRSPSPRELADPNTDPSRST